MPSVRPPAVAGLFYPADARQLAGAMIVISEGTGIVKRVA